MQYYLWCRWITAVKTSVNSCYIQFKSKQIKTKSLLESLYVIIHYPLNTGHSNLSTILLFLFCVCENVYLQMSPSQS